MRLSIAGSDARCRSWLWTLCGVAALLASSIVRAQHYSIEMFTEGEGLPSSTVRGLAQDPSGRMWFSTAAGIAVWDGRSWEVHGEAQGLARRDRSAIAIDERGVPWSLATPPFGDIARWEGERWLSLPSLELPPDCLIQSMAIGRGAAPERLALGSSCGLIVREQDTWRRIEQGLPSRRITAVLRWSDGYLAATWEGLAWLPDGATRAQPPPFDAPAGPVLGLAHDTSARTPRLLVVGTDWVGAVENGRFTTIAEDLDTDPRIMPQAVAPDGNGGVFFGNAVAFHHYHPASGLRLLDEKNGLASAGAEDLLFDREGNVWVAAVRGASRIGSFCFATYRAEHGLLEDEVTAVLERRRGGILLGHPDGVTRVDGEVLRPLQFRGAALTRYGLGRVLDLAEQADGTIWIAANERGLGRMSGESIEWSRAGNRNGVTSVRVDPADRLWVAEGKDVLVDRGNGLRRVPLEFHGNYGVRRLLLGSGGSIYVASMGSGLYRRDGDRWEGWYNPDLSKINSIYAVLERPDGGLWVGTAAGLAEASGHTLRHVAAPAIHRPVYFIVVDGDGRTWFGTDNGALRWDGTRLAHFSVEQGLAGRETNRAAGLLDSRSRLWIGTSRGATIYRPEFEGRIAVAPKLSLIGLEAGDGPRQLDRPIRLASDQNDLVFSFRAIYYRDGGELLLQSRLEGYETDWSPTYASRDQLARYTSLPPGRYRFHLRAGTREGVWSEPVTSPELRIVGPLWSRPWFWAVAVAALAALGYAVQRHVDQSRYARRLEVEVRERLEELRRAQDELSKSRSLRSLGLLAGGIAHDFNNLLTVVMGNLSLLRQTADTDSQRWVADAAAATQRARELTAQLLTFSKGGAPVRRAARVEEVVRDSVRFLPSSSAIRCKVDLPPDLWTVSIDPGQINQVMNNLLLNASQAMADGGVVRITARNTHGIPPLPPTGRYVSIEVRDEGIGIAERHLPRVFDPYFSTREGGTGLGLATSHSIVERHDGLLTVDSRAGRGSTFFVYLPATEGGVAVDPPRKHPARFDDSRILVMDDDEAVRDVLAEMLRSLGCEVVATADGLAAVESYARSLEQGRPFDATILDLTVPGGVGGEEAIRRLREMDPAVRAIVASGYANAPVIANYLDHGFRAVLRKPFECGDLAEALHEVLAPTTHRAG